MKSLKLMTFGTCLALVAGCGGGGGRGNNAPRPTADTTPPSVQSTNPANGADPVSVNVNPEIVLSDALDAATVNAATVVFQNQFGKLIRGDVSYDSARNAIVFTPMLALENGREYVLSVNGATDLAGNAFTATLSFRTFANPTLGITRYSAGDVISWTQSQNDAQGLTIRTDFYDVPGPDLTWFTSDDALEFYFSNTHDANGFFDQMPGR